ncbi:MAG: T9SS type A sorting domain-containing protein [Hymenobacter sp.]|nr:MAG: T9SS type A sorting domain-containing protein [Hymenobacter sp.]
MLATAVGGLPLPGQAQTVSYSAPIVITQGGTYTGNYQSLSSGTPCVRVTTNDPVVLTGCTFSGAGNLVEATEGVNLTIRNCTGQGLTPSIDGQAPGRFVDSYKAKNLVIEHNSFTQTSGILINRWSAGQAGQTLTVRYNRVRNIDGRWRNGGSTLSSFLQLNTVTQLAGVDIAYNEVINTADQSLVEDNINLYNSSGTAQSAIHVHDNFVRGAYPYPATATSYSGTGMTTDGDGNTLALAAGYIEADHNQFVGTGNAAMNLAAGHDIYYHDNRAVTSGTLPDGRRFNAGYAALGIFNYYNQLSNIFFNNRMENNTVGYVRWGSNAPYQDRQDLSPGACATCTGTISLPNPITTATEDAEATLWQQKLQQAGITVGPIGSTTTTSTTSTTAASLLVNPGFELDGAAVGAPTGWLTTTGAGTNANADYTEANGGTHGGTYHGTHYRPDAYSVYTYQVVAGLPNGTYKLSAWVKSSGGQTQALLRAQNFGGTALSTAIAASTSTWVQVSVSGIAVTNGQCEIGFYSNALAGQWLYFDDVELVKQTTNVAPTVALAAASSLTLGQAVALSATAADADGTVSKVEFFSGTTLLGAATAAPYQLSWTPTAAGTYALTAKATDNAGASTTSPALALTVTSSSTVVNPGFELDNAAVGAPTGWLTSGPDANADYSEAYAGAHSGTYHGTHWRTSAYQVYTYQTLSGLANGTYQFSAWVKSSGGQPLAQLRAQNYGGPLLTTSVANATGSWVQVSISGIAVTNGQCEIGFYSQGQANQWFYFDDVTFAPQTTPVGVVLNASFDDDQAAVQTPRQWSTQTWGSTQAYASYTEAYPGAHSGTYHGTHYRPEAYEVYTYQTVTNLSNGTYQLNAWVKSSGGQLQAQLRAQSLGGVLRSTTITAAPSSWVQVSISGIVVRNGQCEVGFYSQAPGGQWLYFDDVELVAQGNGAKSDLAAATNVAATKLYPNPANDQVVVTKSFDHPATTTFVITDLQGMPVAKYQQQVVAGDNKLKLNTSNLPNGLYLLHIEGDNTSVQRLEVKH